MKIKRRLEYRSSPEQRSMLLVLTAGIEYIARIIGRNEIEDARERIIMRGRKCYYRPSQEYIMAREGWFTPKKEKYEKRHIASPFRDDNKEDGKCHSIVI